MLRTGFKVTFILLLVTLTLAFSIGALGARQSTNSACLLPAGHVFTGEICLPDDVHVHVDDLLQGNCVTVKGGLSWDDRVVEGEEVYVDETIYLRGVLRVKGEGRLTLVNVKLFVVYNGSIIVEPGGRVNITDKDGDPSTMDGCLIKTSEPYHLPYFYFNVSEGAVLRVVNSIFDLGYALQLRVSSEGAYIANNSFIGSAELAFEADGCTVLNNVFRGNCSLLLKGDNSSIVNNVIGDGVIVVDGCSGSRIEGNKLTNRKPYGHGLILFSSQADVRGNVFSSCRYGLKAVSSNLTVENCVFSGCKYGLLSLLSHTEAKSCSFANNTYGAFFHSSRGYVKGCTFTQNKYAVYLLYSPQVAEEGNTMSENWKNVFSFNIDPAPFFVFCDLYLNMLSSYGRGYFAAAVACVLAVLALSILILRREGFYERGLRIGALGCILMAVTCIATSCVLFFVPRIIINPLWWPTMEYVASALAEYYEESGLQIYNNVIVFLLDLLTTPPILLSSEVERIAAFSLALSVLFALWAPLTRILVKSVSTYLGLEASLLSRIAGALSAIIPPIVSLTTALLPVLWVYSTTYVLILAINYMDMELYVKECLYVVGQVVPSNIIPVPTYLLAFPLLTLLAFTLGLFLRKTRDQMVSSYAFLPGVLLVTTPLFAVISLIVFHYLTPALFATPFGVKVDITTYIHTIAYAYASIVFPLMAAAFLSLAKTLNDEYAAMKTPPNQ